MITLTRRQIASIKLAAIAKADYKTGRGTKEDFRFWLKRARFNVRRCAA